MSLRVATVIAAPHWGGLQTVVERTTPGIRAAGIERLVLLPVSHPDIRERLERAGATVVDLQIHRPRKSLSPKFLTDYTVNFLRDVDIIKEQLENKQVHIVEVAGLLNLQPVVAAKRARIPLVWQLHSTLAPSVLRRAIGRIACRTADVVMTSGAGMIAKHGGLSGEIIPFCAPVDPNKFRVNRVVRARVREDWGFAPDDIIAGTLGNFGWQKQHDFLVRVAALARDIVGLKFAIVGTSVDSNARSYDRRVRDLVCRLGLNEIVKIIEQRWPADAVMNGFDIFCLTSVAEGASLVTAEALATGLPVVSTDVGSLSDLVRPSKNGFLVRSEAEMADAIRKLAADGTLRKQYGSASRRIIEEEISADRCAQAHVDAYRKALRR